MSSLGLLDCVHSPHSLHKWGDVPYLVVQAGSSNAVFIDGSSLPRQIILALLQHELGLAECVVRSSLMARVVQALPVVFPSGGLGSNGGKWQSESFGSCSRSRDHFYTVALVPLYTQFERPAGSLLR